MSIGGQPSADIIYKAVDIPQDKMTKEETITYGDSIKDVIASKDKVTAYINPKACINCGTCREVCPADAIEEQQRLICHSCPKCTEKPGFSPQKTEELTRTTSCTTACPLGIHPQGYVGLTKIGKYQEAFELIWKKNPLPSVCGSVCHHPCEDACKRGIIVDEAIKIRGVKKFLSEKCSPAAYQYPRIYEERIAIVGAGPAGLTAAHTLAQQGYEVVVYESAAEAGGMLKKGIPEFRLDRTVVDRDIKRLENAGIKIVLDYHISKHTLKQLRAEYDAVIVATGTPNSKELQIPGSKLAGVMGAMTFMRQVNHKMNPEHHLGQIFKMKGGNAIVIGGGSVAMDVARTAIRIGAANVTVVCLEEGDAVPAHAWERKEAEEEGVKIVEGYSPVEFKAIQFPELVGVKFEKVTSMGKDENGKFNICTDANQTLELDADWVVEAIGQQADEMWKDIEGKDIFFAGDITSGKCSVVDAMASGRDCAIKVDAALRGRELKNPMLKHELHTADIMEKIFPYNRLKNFRPDTVTLDVKTRKGCFDEVEGVFTENQIEQETKACLQCGYQMVDPSKCLACGMCQKLCPKGDVITMVIKEEE